MTFCCAATFSTSSVTGPTRFAASSTTCSSSDCSARRSARLRSGFDQTWRSSALSTWRPGGNESEYLSLILLPVHDELGGPCFHALIFFSRPHPLSPAPVARPMFSSSLSFQPLRGGRPAGCACGAGCAVRRHQSSHIQQRQQHRCQHREHQQQWGQQLRRHRRVAQLCGLCFRGWCHLRDEVWLRWVHAC